ncbi:MAG: hypothetical protein GEV08_06090 [Acidimicrobiia bacterium]|nr:hypothetical protein [Acidimicrobiia bacterium]
MADDEFQPENGDRDAHEEALMRLIHDWDGSPRLSREESWAIGSYITEHSGTAEYEEVSSRGLFIPGHVLDQLAAIGYTPPPRLGGKSR